MDKDDANFRLTNVPVVHLKVINANYIEESIVTRRVAADPGPRCRIDVCKPAVSNALRQHHKPVGTAIPAYQ